MRRAKWGVGAVVVVGLAWLLSNLFNIRLGGIGTEDGAQVGLPTRTTIVDSDEEQAPTVPPGQSEPLPDTTDDQSVAVQDSNATTDAVGAGGAVEVLIDDRTFFIRRGVGEHAKWVAAEPAVIASYASQAKGDATGVKVRHFSAAFGTGVRGKGAVGCASGSGPSCFTNRSARAVAGKRVRRNSSLVECRSRSALPIFSQPAQLVDTT